MIYDITRELFSVDAYPGDPIPEKKEWFSLEKGDVCNLTEINIGSHTGTHLDAPRHFFDNGKSISQISLDKCIGKCQVIEWNGKLDERLWDTKIEKETKKIIFKGNVDIQPDGAQKLVEADIELIGVEASTVGAPDKQKEVHEILLGAEIVILENLDLSEIKEGHYIVSATPLKISGVDGSPIRAVLLDL